MRKSWTSPRTPTIPAITEFLPRRNTDSFCVESPLQGSIRFVIGFYKDAAPPALGGVWPSPATASPKILLSGSKSLANVEVVFANSLPAHWRSSRFCNVGYQ
jgi:hypothetical protein